MSEFRKLTRALAYKIGVAAGIAALLSAFVLAIFLVMDGAAWFAFGRDKPAMPWFLVRFFLFIVWVIAACVGACTSVPPPAETGRSEDGER